MQSLSGQVIKTYEVKEQIGAGGFGAVYLAVQPVVNRDVALKVILPQHANQPDFVRRFETEAQLVARLEHPHIVPLYDYWREPNGAYLVMRYLRGGSLRDSLDETGAWSLIQTAQMLNQIAAALSFAHKNSVIHRDLKSDNILLDETGNNYLGDFGIAKDVIRQENLTQDSILGTPAYLSPEQIRGEDATASSDIYALGILVYETLTATKPFFDVTPATVLFKQLHDPLPDILQLRPDLPEEINTILQRATAKDIPDRYQTTLEFARDFQTVVRGTQSPDATVDLYAPTAPNLMSITQVEQEIFEPINPYKGLRAFQTADAGDFYGRSTLIDRLMQSLERKREHADFLAVVGPSGSGKSSVVRAGILPRLQKGVLDEEVDWYVADMVPGTHPLEE
ncbi:MAG: serine/threonine-protein kinase, partial [Aggregatilineales bacterium]